MNYIYTFIHVTDPFCFINLFLQVLVAVGSKNGSSVLLWQGKNIGNCLTTQDDDYLSSSHMSYPELEIAEPTGDMVKCWKDV